MVRDGARRRLPDRRMGARRRLGSRQILQTMVEVCRIVHAAHQRGIIHRDLKPANFSVDRDRDVRIIDFGVAAAMSSEVIGSAGVTLEGAFVGTLRYTAPEQLGADARPDVRADVYSLGMMLHELLTGTPALPVDGVPFLESVRILGERDPVAARRLAQGVAGRRRVHRREGHRQGPAAPLPVGARDGMRPGEPSRGPHDRRRQGGRLGAPRRIRAPSPRDRRCGQPVARGHDRRDRLRDPRICCGRGRPPRSAARNMEWVSSALTDPDTASIERVNELLPRLDARTDPDDPGRLDLVKSDALQCKGELLHREREYAAALGVQEKALAIRQRVLRERPGDAAVLGRLSISYVKIGDLSKDQWHLAEAKPLYQRALEIDEALVASHPAERSYRDQLCWSYERCGWLAWHSGDPKLAQRLWQSRHSLALELVRDAPAHSASWHNLYCSHAFRHDRRHARRP